MLGAEGVDDAGFPALVDPHAHCEVTMAAEVRLTLLILAVEDLSLAVNFYRAAFAWIQTGNGTVYAKFPLPGSQRHGLYARTRF